MYIQYVENYDIETTSGIISKIFINTEISMGHLAARKICNLGFKILFQLAKSQKYPGIFLRISITRKS